MISVRELTHNDIEHIAKYWLEPDADHMKNMGVDLNKLPDRQQLVEGLQMQLNTPVEQRNAYCLIWEVDGIAIGHCNTNPTRFGEEAYMHLHIWNTGQRKKGLGVALVKESLPYFFENLKLKTLYCQPYALNPAPNKTLAKVGFEFLKEFITTPGAINFEQPVKQWRLTAEAFETLNA